jgi:hypothetical protein
MIDIEGIETQTNQKGEITHLTLDVVKYRDILEPILEQLALSEKESFNKNWETGISIEDARKKTHDYINQLWKK